MYGVELITIIISTFGQAISGSGHSVNVIGPLISGEFLWGLALEEAILYHQSSLLSSLPSSGEVHS
jgi:hypothetical protein